MMTEPDKLESWLKENNLSELLPILTENEVDELSDLQGLDDESQIDEFIETLSITSDLQTQFKTALLASLASIETFDKMDKALSDYYESLERKDYINSDNQSKLKEFMNINDLDEKNVQDQLGENAEAHNCSFVDMDQDFPLSVKIQNTAQRLEEIFKIFQYCYKYGTPPDDDDDDDDDDDYDDDDDDDDCYQEAYIDPSNKERLQPIWNSDNMETDIIFCIGSLRIEFVNNKLSEREFLHGTATVIHIDENNCCHVLTAAHNGYQLLRKCSVCKKRTISSICTKCNKRCRKIKPLELIQATSITFHRRCIVQKQRDVNTGVERVFGDPISSYFINNYFIYNSLYKQYATPRSGYDICIMTFQCNKVKDVKMYRKICGQMKLICDPTFGNFANSAHRLHIFGYPADKYYIDENSNINYKQKIRRYQMFGMSTGIKCNNLDLDLKVETHVTTKKKYVVNGEIDTQPGMSGSIIWTVHGHGHGQMIGDEEFLIYAVHTGGKQEKDCGKNYGTFLDDDHINWIKRVQYKLLLKPGFNIIASTKREYIIPELKEDEYAFRGGGGYKQKNVLTKITIRGLSGEDDEKQIIFKVTKEECEPEKLFVDTNHKIILVCGKTGTGKTTLINSMMNYICGIEKDDKYRMKLIKEMKKDGGDAKSQTDHISSYTIKKPMGGKINYDLTIIDTPGFGDTRGIEKDMQTTEEFKYIFNKILANISGICFIVKSPDEKLDATQTYVFNNMLNLWGKNVADNIFILMTWADGAKPACIAALQANDVLKKCKHRIPINNSAFTKLNTSNKFTNKFDELFWKMGMESFSTFFDTLDTMEPKPLGQSIKVLLKREQIQTELHHIMKEFNIHLSKQSETEKNQKYVESQRQKVDEGKEVKWPVKESYFVEEKIEGWNNYAFSCKNCGKTCHKCYNIKGFFNTLKRMFGRSNCIMVDNKNNCKHCGCHYNNHDQNIEYIQKTKIVYKSSWDDDVKYQRAQQDINIKKLSASEQILKQFEEESKKRMDDMVNGLTKIRKLRGILAEIALRPQVKILGTYIDDLIDLEKKSTYKESNKIQFLQQLKEQEVFLQQLKEQEVLSDILKSKDIDKLIKLEEDSNNPDSKKIIFLKEFKKKEDIIAKYQGKFQFQKVHL